MPFSAAKCSVFNAFKYSLGIGEIKGSNYKNLKVYLTDSNFFNTNWRRIKGKKYTAAVEAEKQLNYNTIRLGDLRVPYRWSADGQKEGEHIIKGSSTSIYPTNLTVSHCSLNSFNKDTGETNTSSYEGMLNIAASSKIFTRYNHNNSWVTGDLDWVNSTALLNENLRKYFSTEYNFNNEYNKTEYQSYGLNENKLTENVIRLSAESFILNEDKKASNKEAMNRGAAGVLLTYVDEDKGFSGENELPVAFYDFGKTLHSNYNFLQIDWHEDGIIKAE